MGECCVSRVYTSAAVAGFSCPASALSPAQSAILSIPDDLSACVSDSAGSGAERDRLFSTFQWNVSVSDWTTRLSRSTNLAALSQRSASGKSSATAETATANLEFRPVSPKTTNIHPGSGYQASAKGSAANARHKLRHTHSMLSSLHFLMCSPYNVAVNTLQFPRDRYVPVSVLCMTSEGTATVIHAVPHLLHALS